MMLGRGGWPRQGMLSSFAFSLFSQDLVHAGQGTMPLSYVPVPKVFLLNYISTEDKNSILPSKETKYEKDFSSVL